MDKSIYLWCFFNTVVTGIAPFIWIIAPKLLIDELQGGQNQQRILVILAITLLVTCIVHYCIHFFKGKFRMKMAGVRFAFIRLINVRGMSMPFALTEDPETLDAIKHAWYTLSNPYKGVGGVMQKLFTVFGGLVGFFLYSTIISTLSPIVLIYFMINVWVTYRIHRKSNAFYSEKDGEAFKHLRKSGYFNDTMADFMYGKDLRLYGMRKFLVEKKKVHDQNYMETIKDMADRKWKTQLMDGLLLLLREGIVYGYLIYQVLDGMSVGNFIMYSVAIGGFAAWMENLIKELAELRRSTENVNNLQNFLDGYDEEKEEGTSRLPKDEKYEIVFDNVSFKYPNADSYIFKNFNLTIRQGEKLAIVGVNGAGKTTLIKMLTRLYPLTEGRILLNGVDITSYNLKEYFTLFSVVFQDITKLAFTVGENISLEEGAQDQEGLTRVSKMAGIYDKIETLPHKFDTNMLKIIYPDGIDLSGGESQKLALARALYKDGKIVILDEPTAALDPLAEKNIYEGFNNLIGQRTAIYVSHRLSSTKFCDRIAYFENGKVEEYGTHEELMNLKGKYADMFDVQAMYYKEEISEEVLGGGVEYVS